MGGRPNSEGVETRTAPVPLNYCLLTRIQAQVRRDCSITSYMLCYAESLQPCLTLCDPMDCSLPGSSDHGILHGLLSSQEYWSGLPWPPPRYLPNPGIKPASTALASRFFTTAAAAAAAKSLRSCPTLCDPIDGSPPGSPVPGILQARTLEWVAISFSNA